MSELSIEKSDQKLRSTFFRSITIVASAAAIILAGSEGLLFPSALTPLFAVVGWLLAEHVRWFRFPVILGNLFGVVAFFVAADEFIGGTLEQKLLAGSHLIVYLSWIVLLLPKGNRQFWWLIALSVLQLAIAGLLSGGINFGLSMLAMLLLLLWTLSVFSLFRVQDQHARGAVQQQSALSATASTSDPRNSAGSTVRQGSSSTADSSSVNSASAKKEKRKRFLLTFFGLTNLLELKRQTAASHSSEPFKAGILVRNGLQRDSSETWVGWRFRWMVAGSYLISVALALIVFAAFPRVWVPGSTLLGDATPNDGGFRNRTGFTESVQLGDIGQIMLNNQRVLAFDIVNKQTEKKVSVENFEDAMNMDEIRFRGNVMGYYSEGQWSRGFEEKGFGRGEEIRRLGEFTQLPFDFRLNIVQDPPPAVFAFSPYPVCRVTTGSGSRIEQTEVSGSLVWMGRSGSENVSRTFTVECPRLDQHPELTFEFWATPANLPPSMEEQLDQRRLEFAISLFVMDGFKGPMYRRRDGVIIPQERMYARDGDLKFKLPRLYETANSVCTRNGELVEPPERVQRIVSHLAAENGFRYSLTPSRSDRSLDPVEDFLINTRSGHCEYFASACVLMLQSVQVPARLINGFSGAEINGLSGKYEVSQRHAHAWAEAFVDNRWRTVDPTPASDRQEGISSVQTVKLISNIQTALSDFWNDGIHQMSAERQQEFFAPVISTSKSLYETIRDKGLWNTMRQSVTNFLNSPSSWISWQGGIVTFVLLLSAAGLARLNVFRKLAALWRLIPLNLWKRQQTSRSVIRFYEGFCSLCERHGLPLPPSNSALENAALAIQHFKSRLASPDLESLPERIAVAFNEVRFGSLTLSDDQATSIGRDLNTFAEALKGQNPAVAVSR